MDHLSPYFSRDPQGNLRVHHGDDWEASSSVSSLISTISYNSSNAPVLLHFKHILQDRMRRLYQAFDTQAARLEYPAAYTLAYPIKTNPKHHVLDTLIQSSNDDNKPFFIEVGSRPELLAALSLTGANHTIICNGFKDLAYYQLAHISASCGYHLILVIEHINELQLLDHILEQYDTLHIDLGIRVKGLNNDAHHAKFGLNLPQISSVLRWLEGHSQTDKLTLLHCHDGSQASCPERLQQKVAYLTRLYAELSQRCPKLGSIDIGGGLAVDYQGNSETHCNFNHYAYTVLSTALATAKQLGVVPPAVISESGRAITAHADLLLVPVLTQSSAIPHAKECELTERWLKGELSLADIHDDKNASGAIENSWLNFSLFQSLPDHWGLKQHFPLQALFGNQKNGACEQRLFDISCDPDGRIDDAKLPALNDDDYLVIFLVGAYQNVLNSKHNMIGHSAEAWVDFTSDGRVNIQVIQAENNHALLRQFGYNPLKLLSKLKRKLYQRNEQYCQNEASLLDTLLKQSPYLNKVTRRKEKDCDTLAC